MFPGFSSFNFFSCALEFNVFSYIISRIGASRFFVFFQNGIVFLHPLSSICFSIILFPELVFTGFLVFQNRIFQISFPAPFDLDAFPSALFPEWMFLGIFIFHVFFQVIMFFPDVSRYSY